MKLQIQTYSEKEELVDILSLARDYDYQVISKRSSRLLRDIFVRINGETKIIKNGFVFGASIPKIFWRVIGKPTNQKFALASLVHDYLYKIKYNRDRSDEIFRTLLDWSGVNGHRVALMFYAVRLGGHAFYAARANNDRWTTKFWRWTVKNAYSND